MQIKNKQVEKLLEFYREIYTLNKISALLSWDLNVNLPENGGQERAEQSAYLAGKVADLWLNSSFKNTLQSVQAEKGLNDWEKAIVRNLSHNGKFYFSVPREIIVEFEETSSKAFLAWREARANNDFNLFLPHLRAIVRLNQIVAKHIGYESNPYDALLDMYEPGLTTEKCRGIFDSLTPRLASLLVKIKRSELYKKQQKEPDKMLTYDKDSQEQLAQFVLRKIGFDLRSGRQDVSAHPFTITLGSSDVRVTNRYKDDNYVESIMVALHEGGHGLYELGVDDSFSGTPLEGGVSLGIHESQSRFWENQLGRSEEFARFIAPILQAMYPKQLGGVNYELIMVDFNRVNPGLIRVEADEVTYNLHIALRFEIEEALINNRIKPDDLPEIWNKKMKKYLGVVPDNNANGVLQDVHWSQGSIGYFPTYTLGNLYATQFANKLNKDLDLAKLTGQGEFGSILAWFRDNVHQHGAFYWPEELVKMVTSETLKPKYFVKYLEDKYGRIYNL